MARPYFAGRTVEDVARLFSVLTGPDSRDPLTQPSVNPTIPAAAATAVDYTQYLKADGLKGARIGVYREATEQGQGASEKPHPDYLKAHEAALAAMAAAGATIVGA